MYVCSVQNRALTQIYIANCRMYIIQDYTYAMYNVQMYAYIYRYTYHLNSCSVSEYTLDIYTVDM